MVTTPTYTDTRPSSAAATNAAAQAAGMALRDAAILTAYAHDPSMGIHVDAAWRETVFAALMKESTS